MEREASSVMVVGMARTPFGRFGGALKAVDLPELGAVAVRAAIERSGLSPEEIEEVVLGVNFPGTQRSVARQVMLESGIPEHRNALTVDRACCSSLAAMATAGRSLRLGDTRVALAGGVDNLSRVPYFLPEARFGQRLGTIELRDQLQISCPMTGVPRAVQAGVEATSFGIGREEQDAWALRSQQRHAAALADGRFIDEMAEVDLEGEGGTRVELAVDEPPRPETTAEKLARLPTVYGSPTVTAGNAPDMSSGASALVLVSAEEASARAMQPLAELAGWAQVSGDPQKLASMPARAAEVALARAGVDLDDLDLLEINEAFAAVPLVTTHVLSGGDPALRNDLRERTNVNGGAVAVGHPTGATAGRLVMTIIAELRRRGGGTGLVTICGGIGEAEAVVVRAR